MQARTVTKGERTHERILLKAMELFHARGAHQVSLAEIARALELHQTAIYVHFKNRDDLLGACCEYAVQASREDIEAATDPEWPALRKLRAYFEGQFRFVRDYPERANALLAMYYHGPQSPRLAAIHRWVDERSTTRIEQLLTAHAGRRDLALREQAHRLHSQLVGEMIKALCRPRERTLAKRLDSLMAQVAGC